MNGRLEHLCGSALGFRNTTGELPSTGGQKPHMSLVVDVPMLTAYTGDGMGTRSALTGLFEFALGSEAARRVSCDSAVDTVIVDPSGFRCRWEEQRAPCHQVSTRHCV